MGYEKRAFVEIPQNPLQNFVKFESNRRRFCCDFFVLHFLSPIPSQGMAKHTFSQKLLPPLYRQYMQFRKGFFVEARVDLTRIKSARHQYNMPNISHMTRYFHQGGFWSKASTTGVIFLQFARHQERVWRVATPPWKIGAQCPLLTVLSVAHLHDAKAVLSTSMLILTLPPQAVASTR